MKVKYQFNSQYMGEVQNFFEGDLCVSVDYEFLREKPASGIGKLVVATVGGHNADTLASLIEKENKAEYWKELSGKIEPYQTHPLGFSLNDPDAIRKCKDPEIRKVLEKSQKTMDTLRKASRLDEKRLHTPFTI